MGADGFRNCSQKKYSSVVGNRLVVILCRTNPPGIHGTQCLPEEAEVSSRDYRIPSFQQRKIHSVWHLPKTSEHAKTQEDRALT